VLDTYLHKSKYGFVLLQPENRQLATKLVGPDVIDICQMDDVIATNLLRASLIRKDLVNDHESHYSILHSSASTLAITQAASYINETAMSIATYCRFFKAGNVMVEIY